ncbi:MAG TPA: murein biosynthesis integral membrane protein MurJ, partial [Ktedonobacteraceae bacterium]
MTQQRMSIGQAALIITLATLMARVFGLLRGSLFTAVFGATTISDAFNRAFVIPNAIYTIVTGGALVSAFIPVFNAYLLEKGDETEAWRVASDTINLATLVMVGIGGITVLFARQLVTLYNPGVSASELDLVAELTRIMMLQAIVMGVGIVISSILNARQHFFLPALGSVLYSVGLIIGLLPGFVLVRLHHSNPLLAVYCAAGGVVLGAALMVGCQLPGLRSVKMRYILSRRWLHPGVLQIARLMVPRVISSIAVNLSQAADIVLISLLAFAGFVTQYLLAFTVMMIPQGMVINVATAMFPSMTEYAVTGRMDRFRAIVREALRSTLFISVPSAIGLIILSLPIIQVLYEHGPFTYKNAVITSIPLMGYAIGLPGWAVGEILTRAFYALRDSKTPVVVSVWQFTVKIALSLILLDPVIWFAQMRLGATELASAWGMGAMAFSTSVAILLEMIVLLWLLHQRIGGLRLRRMLPFIYRVLLASAAMVVAVIGTRWLLDLVLVTNNVENRSLAFTGIMFMFIKV